METKPAQAEVVEDGTQRDRRGRVKVKAERREELVAEYRHSGLSQAEFARRACVNYQTFAHWGQRARREAAEAAPLATPAMPRFAGARCAARSRCALVASVSEQLAHPIFSNPRPVFFKALLQRIELLHKTREKLGRSKRGRPCMPKIFTNFLNCANEECFLLIGQGLQVDEVPRLLF